MNRTIFATYSGSDLSAYADAVNRGTNDPISFYVNGDRASVSRIYGDNMPESEQKDLLVWFLGGRFVSFS